MQEKELKNRTLINGRFDKNTTNFNHGSMVRYITYYMYSYMEPVIYVRIPGMRFYTYVYS